MSVTLNTIRQRMCQAIGIYSAETTTAAGETDGSALTCTRLDFADDALQDKYIKITSGATLETRKIRNNYFNEGVIRPYVPFSAAIATAVTFEIHDFDPSNYIHYVNEALRDAYPYLSLQTVNSEGLIGNNILPLATFDEWASALYPDYTTLVTATAAKESTNVLLGTYSLKMSVAAGTCYYSSDSWRNLLSLEGKTIDYYRFVKTTAASTARLYVTTVTVGGVSTTETSDYHTGGGKWELLKVSATIPSISQPSETTDLAEVRIGCQTSTTTASYFDKGYVQGDVDEYLLPSNLSVNKAFLCNSWYEPNTIRRTRLDFNVRNKSGVRYLLIEGAPSAYKMELEGYMPFTSLALDTSTLELSTNWERVIEFGAIANMLRAQATPLSSRGIKEPLGLADVYSKRFEDGKRRYDMRPTLTIPRI